MNFLSFVFKREAKTLSRACCLLLVMTSIESYSQSASRVRPSNVATKYYEPVKEEREIRRSRVNIRSTIETKKKPALINPEDTSFEKARQFKLDQKTSELIEQLEALVKRPGQQSRVGELKMRLAELYYDRAQSVAAKEAEQWEKQVQAWENLRENVRLQTARPTLKTPRADALRRKSLVVYLDLEKMSRGGDKGRALMVRRDEVLFYLSATYRDLGETRRAEPYYRELTSDFVQSPRIFSARLNLADIYFDQGKHREAIPLYLLVASGQGAAKDQTTESIKAYALYKLGWAYMNTAAYDRSVLSYKRAVEASIAFKSDRSLVLKKEALYDMARAYALLGNFSEAEAYFSEFGSEADEARARYDIEAASVARDSGRTSLALQFYDRLIEKNPKAWEAREYAIEKLKIYERQKNVAAFQKALDEFALSYGERSAWLRAQEPDQRPIATQELVSLLRREAKNNHRNAQQKNQDILFSLARGFYSVYFNHVPSPNADTETNLHEMRFYFAELLYRIGEYELSAKYYSNVGAGPHAATARFSNILALRKAAEGSKSNKGLSEQLMAATESFVAEHPNDERAAGLLYSSAQEAFKTGDSKESVATLRRVVDQFSGEKTGVEAAERILFILDKEENYDALVLESQEFLKNPLLVKAGGATFKNRLQEYQQKSLFKRAEKLSNPQNKAAAFLELASNLQGALKESALNNALVFSREAKDAALVARSEAELVAHFPKSNFAKDVYFRMGEAATVEGNWGLAKKHYSTYVANYSKQAKAADEDVQAARWNLIFIEAHIQEGWYSSFEPRSSINAALLSDLESFVNDYPKSKHRLKAFEILAFRRGVSVAQVRNYLQMAQLSNAEKALLQEAELVAQVRAKQNYSTIVKSQAISSTSSALKKRSVAEAAFALLETKFNAHQKRALNYAVTAFVQSLQAKLKGLEDLEKEYLRVVAFGDGEVALRTLERLSRLYRGLGHDILKAPVPKEDLAPFVDPLFAKSQSFLKTCFEKAAELKIGGSGLHSCQNAASEIEADFSNLDQEKFADPQWVPLGLERVLKSPMAISAFESLKKSRIGEASLAVSVVRERKDVDLSHLEKSLFDLIEGLSFYRYSYIEDAAKGFRLAMASSDKNIKNVAIKNLTALYLNVADFEQAIDTIRPIARLDADTLALAALAHKGVGEISESLDAYDRALALDSNNPVLHFNKSFALAASNAFNEAAKSMQRYIELSKPAANDISRSLFRRWKGRASNEKLAE